MATPAPAPCIDSFTGEYRFLSNFAQISQPLQLWDQLWRTSEHAYQAGKASSPSDLRWIRDAPTAREAQRRGQAIELRPDWDEIKRATMLQVVFTKFSRPELRNQLVATGNAKLVEGNSWGDDYWGAVPDTKTPEGQLWVCPGGTYLAGRNWLGRILMSVRELLAPEAP